MVENRLMWFEHVMRKYVDYVIMRVNKMNRTQTTRGRRRHKHIIRKIIKKISK